MALIEKETLLKGLWEVALVVVSGAICVFGSRFVVNRALASLTVPLGAPVAGGQPMGSGQIPPPLGAEGHGAVALETVASPEVAKVEEETKAKEHGKEKKKKEKKEGHGKGEEGEKSARAGLTYPLRTTVVNLATDSDHRFAKVSITLEADSTGVVDELKEMDHQIYDCLIDTLGNVRAQDIGTDAGKDMLKETLRQKMNKFLTAGEILNVYMTEFLVQ